MKITHADQVEEKLRIHQHRQGTFKYRRLMEGEAGTPGNFLLEMVHTTDDFFSPRHRHNFDQFRYQIDGEFDFDRNGRMKPGILGYFPEATPYGPQTSSVASLTLVLQFGGASGSGYLAQTQVEAGAQELKKHGVFEKGIYRRNDGEEGKKNMDGFQAVWEHVNKRKMIYPEPRYHDPIMMNPAHFAWVALDDAPGVSEKLMGVFTEARTGSRFLRLDPNAKYKLHGRSLGFVLSGEGQLAGQAYRKHTTLHCETGESAEYVASSPTEILVLDLPRVAREASHAAAAE
jgi:hypothetical protein